MDKRDFLKSVGAASFGAVFASPAGRITDAWLVRAASTAPAELAHDDDFWTALRGKYRLHPDRINLENGYYSMQSEEVLEAFVKRVRAVNLDGSYYMRTRMANDKLAVQKRVAALAGCGDDELIITSVVHEL